MTLFKTIWKLAALPIVAAFTLMTSAAQGQLVIDPKTIDALVQPQLQSQETFNFIKDAAKKSAAEQKKASSSLSLPDRQ